MKMSEGGGGGGEGGRTPWRAQVFDLFGPELKM